MKQFKLLVLSLIVLQPYATWAAYNTFTHKNSEYYIRANIGFPFYRKVKQGFQDYARFMPYGNLAVGMRYKKIGAEIEGGYLYFKTRSTLCYNIRSRSSLNSKFLFLNLFFYPTLLKDKIRPYAGAGVGRAFNDMGNRYGYFGNKWQLAATGLKVRDTALQGIIGGEYMLNSKFSMLADARYIYLGKFRQKYITLNGRSSEKLSIVTFIIGGKYKFN